MVGAAACARKGIPHGRIALAAELVKPTTTRAAPLRNAITPTRWHRSKTAHLRTLLGVIMPFKFGDQPHGSAQDEFAGDIKNN